MADFRHSRRGRRQHQVFQKPVLRTCLTSFETRPTSNAIAGETSLDRLANALGGKVVLPSIVRNITTMLHSGVLCVRERERVCV